MIAFGALSGRVRVVSDRSGARDRWFPPGRFTGGLAGASAGLAYLCELRGEEVLATAHSWLGMFPRLARVMRPAAALLGLPLSTYTAALVTNTSVPAWHEARRMLPLVFGAGACLSAGACGVISTPASHAAAARRLAVGGAAAELAFNEVMHRRLGQQGEAYKRDPPANLVISPEAPWLVGRRCS